MDSNKGISKLNGLENDRFQEGLLKYPDGFTLVDDILQSLSHGFLGEGHDENRPFLAFYAQACADLQLAVLSTLRQHDVQSCLMLRHALESVGLAAYSTVFKSSADGNEVVAAFGDKDKGYKWIEAGFPEDSQKLKVLKKKINDNFAHSNILTAATRLSEVGGKLNLHFFDTNSSRLMGSRLYVIAEIGWLAMDLLEKAVKKANNGITVQPGMIARLNDYSTQIDKVFAELKTAKN